MAFSFKKRKRPLEKEKNWAKNQRFFAYIIKERKTIGIAGRVQQKKDKIIELRREQSRRSSPIINKSFFFRRSFSKLKEKGITKIRPSAS